MTPQEFKAARMRLGLSASQLASILATDLRTLRRWESVDGTNSRPPNPIAVRIVEWLLAGYRPPEWPAEPRGVSVEREV